PAHDPNDFEAAKRNHLPALLVIDGDARMTSVAGPYAGLDRYEARAKVVEDLTAQGLLVRIDKHQYALGHCDRCKTVVEPLLSTQWFCRMQPLAEPAIRAVEDGRTRFYPENWSKLYFEWMRNIHDWCISRQLWWGHRIPAWYCDKCNTITVEVDAPARCSGCGADGLRQETDVLDTWFSSGLWPFSVFGWPEKTPELQYYYPTSTLVTGFDIIFFWVARMMMFGMKFMNDVPFRDCYIHGLVRDEHGQKMSKSKGNTLDPMELIDEYGSDPVRFTMAVLAVPGPDIPLAPKRILGYKAFINKLWNSVRFALMRVTSGEDLAPLRREHWDVGDRWIASRFQRVAGEINEALKEYRFDLAANAAYHYLWNEFCDWYVEWIKPHLAEGQPHSSAHKGLLLQRVCDVLRLLHPIIPFVTEHLWKQIPESIRPAKHLITASYPQPDASLVDPEAESQFDVLMELVSKIRQVRAEMNIDPARRVHVYIKGAAQADLIHSRESEIQLLTRSEKLDIVTAFPSGTHLARGVLSGYEIAVDLAGVLDIRAETERLQKELKKIDAELQQVEKKLSNENFIKNAKPEVVEEQKAKHADLAGRRKISEEHLNALR
ncbi:MAG TPA: valine--tRNA ligase, partial [Acidobacteriota bacterium]|nr:valine--tRNA ligase [Acidobacteriota bacterium]